MKCEQHPGGCLLGALEGSRWPAARGQATAAEFGTTRHHRNVPHDHSAIELSIRSGTRRCCRRSWRSCVPHLYWRHRPVLADELRCRRADLAFGGGTNRRTRQRKNEAMDVMSGNRSLWSDSVSWAVTVASCWPSEVEKAISRSSAVSVTSNCAWEWTPGKIRPPGEGGQAESWSRAGRRTRSGRCQWACPVRRRSGGQRSRCGDRNGGVCRGGGSQRGGGSRCPRLRSRPRAEVGIPVGGEG